MTLINVFVKAEQFVKDNYPEDLEAAYIFLSIAPDEINKDFFFLQYVHVVYCSGFKWGVVNKNWSQLKEAYRGFDYQEVNRNRERVRRAAQRVINHKPKIEAIIETAKTLTTWSEDAFRSFIDAAQKNIDTLEVLPYIGKVTKYHLGICLGFNMIKPDVHLQRLADHYKMSPFDMCEKLSKETGHPRRIVDAILWRASEQKAINVSWEDLK